MGACGRLRACESEPTQHQHINVLLSLYPCLSHAIEEHNKSLIVDLCKRVEAQRRIEVTTLIFLSVIQSYIHSHLRIHQTKFKPWHNVYHPKK